MAFMKWHPRTFANLAVDEVVEFFDVGVDPNESPDATPWQEGPVRIKTSPQPPGPTDGAQSGLMVRAGADGLRVRDDEHRAWIREGRYGDMRIR